MILFPNEEKIIVCYFPGVGVDDVRAGRDVVAEEVGDVAERAKGDRHRDLEAYDPVYLKVLRLLHLPHSPDHPESERIGKL